MGTPASQSEGPTRVQGIGPMGYIGTMDEGPTMPETPPSELERRAIVQRWAQFADWLSDASAEVSLYRAAANAEACRSIDPGLGRMRAILGIQDRYLERIVDLETAERAFRRAYDDALAALDWGQIEAWREAVDPLLEPGRQRARQLAARQMQERMLQRADERHALIEGRQERKRARRARSAVRSTEDRDSRDEERGVGRGGVVPETDRAEEAPDEGAGG